MPRAACAGSFGVAVITLDTPCLDNRAEVGRRAGPLDVLHDLVVASEGGKVSLLKCPVVAVFADVLADGSGQIHAFLR